MIEFILRVSNIAWKSASRPAFPIAFLNRWSLLRLLFVFNAPAITLAASSVNPFADKSRNTTFSITGRSSGMISILSMAHPSMDTSFIGTGWALIAPKRPMKQFLSLISLPSRRRYSSEGAFSTILATDSMPSFPRMLLHNRISLGCLSWRADTTMFIMSAGSSTLATLNEVIGPVTSLKTFIVSCHSWRRMSSYFIKKGLVYALFSGRFPSASYDCSIETQRNLAPHSAHVPPPFIISRRILCMLIWKFNMIVLAAYSLYPSDSQ